MRFVPQVRKALALHAGGRAVQRLLTAQGPSVRGSLGISATRGKPPGEEVVGDDYAAIDYAFRALQSGHASDSQPLNKLFARFCGGPGARVQNGLRTPSPVTYRHNQLWRGDHPLPATPLSATSGLTVNAIATSAPETPGFSTHDYFWLLWEHRATDALSFVPGTWWPRDQATFGDITVRRLAHQIREIPALTGKDLGDLVQPWNADLWIPTLSRKDACTTKEPLEIATYALQRGNAQRLITYHQYSRWPDLGVIHGKTLAALVRSVGQQRGNGPLVVNCLAGVGRTGSYLCAEALAQRGTLGDGYGAALTELFKLRAQRPQMVQREVQFFGVLAALPHLSPGC